MDRDKLSFHANDMANFGKRLDEVICRHKNIAYAWKIIFGFTVFILIICFYSYLESERIPYTTVLDHTLQLKWLIVCFLATLFIFCIGAPDKMKCDHIIIKRCKNVLYNYKLDCITNGKSNNSQYLRNFM